MFTIPLSFTLAVLMQDAAPRCPATAANIEASCRQITYRDLPKAVLPLLQQLKCDASPGNYDYGSAVDLNGDGSPEYLVCCYEAPHGPCSAVLVGFARGRWKLLRPRTGLISAFAGACNGFRVLKTEHNGYHDICLPAECAPGTWKGNGCDALILGYGERGYRESKAR